MSVDISIIIPVYNVEKYLKQCLDSVINITKINTQIIIVNDGSTDNSESIINEYLKTQNNIVYISQLNKGLSIARNIGLQHAIGDYIIFLDSDDYLDTKHINELYNKAKENNSDILIYGYKYFYDNSNKFHNSVFRYNENSKYNGSKIANEMLVGYVKGYAWNKLINRNYLINNKLEFENGVYIEDYFPIFRLIHNCNSIYFYNNNIYNYRQRPGSISYCKNKKLINDFMLCNKQVLEYVYKYKNDFDIECINAYKADSFNYILTLLFEMNRKNIYNTFRNIEYKNYEIRLLDIIKNKYIPKKTKLSILLWKLRVYHITMPILRSFQKYIIK